MGLITTEQASKILGVTSRTVSIWLKKEILPGYKLGAGEQAEWRIDEETLQKFILSRANKLQRDFNEGREPIPTVNPDNTPDDTTTTDHDSDSEHLPDGEPL